PGYQLAPIVASRAIGARLTCESVQLGELAAAVEIRQIAGLIAPTVPVMSQPSPPPEEGSAPSAPPRAQEDEWKLMPHGRLECSCARRGDPQFELQPEVILVEVGDYLYDLS